MDARKGNIYEILNGNKQFLIPVYQRFYSWDIDQCKRLWNDIVELHPPERKRACHSGIPDVSCDRLFYGRKTAFGSDV